MRKSGNTLRIQLLKFRCDIFLLIKSNQDKLYCRKKKLKMYTLSEIAHIKIIKNCKKGNNKKLAHQRKHKNYENIKQKFKLKRTMVKISEMHLHRLIDKQKMRIFSEKHVTQKSCRVRFLTNFTNFFRVLAFLFSSAFKMLPLFSGMEWDNFCKQLFCDCLLNWSLKTTEK